MLPSSAGTSESSKAHIKQADYSTLMKEDFLCLKPYFNHCWLSQTDFLKWYGCTPGLANAVNCSLETFARDVNRPITFDNFREIMFTVTEFSLIFHRNHLNRNDTGVTNVNNSQFPVGFPVRLHIQNRALFP